MKKNLKLFFTVLLIFSMIGAFPIIRERVFVEGNNDTYQIALNIHTILKIHEEKDRESYYKDLKEVGVNTISFDNLSIKELSEYRDIKYVTIETYFNEKEDFNYEVDDLISKYTSRYHFLVMISKEDFLEEELNILKKHFGNYEFEENEDDLFIYVDEPIEIVYGDGKTPNSLLIDKLMIDEKHIKEVYDNGMQPILNIVNVKNSLIQESLFSQISYLIDEYGVNKVQVANEMIGYPSSVNRFLELFKQKDVLVATTEFDTALGLTTYINQGQENLIRAHSINHRLLKLSNNEFAERIARGVKERNMRLILISDFIDYRTKEYIETSSKSMISLIKLAKSELNGYEIGEATNFNEIEDYKKEEIFVGVGFASIMALLALSFVNKERIAMLSSIIMFLISFIFAFIALQSKNTMLLKLYALFVSIVGASAAIIVPYKLETNSISIKYLYSCCMSLISGFLVSSILYGTEYLLKLESFVGVKVLYILPVIIVCIFMILDSNVLSNLSNLKNIDKLKEIDYKAQIKKIKIHHIVITAICLVGGYVYILRSGNTSNVSEIEMTIRATLERILNVRPRTKEFLIGYPALLIAFYMMKKNVKYVPYVLIVGSIGTMSTVNTFTHLHTPLVNSLLRSFYGFLFGAIIGIVFIQIFNFIMSKFKREA